MTDIYIPTFKDIVLPFEANGGLAGRYRMRTGKNMGYMDAASGLWIPGRDVVTQEFDWFENIITNNGMDLFGTISSYLNYCHVGTGTTLEAVSDTALGTFVAGQAYDADVSKSYNGVQASPPYYGRAVRHYRFGEGAAEGNIAEVGISNQLTTGNLFSRARVKDGGGTPTTISVLADEYLDVDYELRLYPDHILSGGGTDDGTGTVSGVGYTIRPAKITTHANWGAIVGGLAGITSVSFSFGKMYSDDAALGAVTGEPSASANSDFSTSGDSANTGSYAPASHYRDMAFISALDEGVFGASNGIKGLMLYTRCGTYQIVLATEQPKDATEIFTFNFRTGWGRHTF